MSDSVTPWTVAHQALPSMGFSRQEYQSGLPFPSPGDLPDPGIKATSPALVGGFFTTESPRKPPKFKHMFYHSYFLAIPHGLWILVMDLGQRLNRCPWQWKRRVLATGAAGEGPNTVLLHPRLISVHLAVSCPRPVTPGLSD